MNGVPLTCAAAFFAASEPSDAVDHAMYRSVTSAGLHERQNACMWCLRLFEPASQQFRATRERGRLRTNLMMCDTGTELKICDNCWEGAFGAKTLMSGVLTPCDDPSEVPNPLLRPMA
jgi:hypothetical protein